MKHYTITTAADLTAALADLDHRDFLAEMADDFMVWRREKTEVEADRREVLRQAKAKGLEA